MEQEWKLKAECRNHPADWWYPSRGDDREARAAAAIDICWHVCPVQTECARYARRKKERAGVWGGIDLGETESPVPARVADALRAVAEGVTA